MILRRHARGPSTFEVLIAGGGVAALESALALQETMGESVRTTLVAPRPEFVYRPMAVVEPFARRPPRRLSLERFAADAGASFIEDSVTFVDSERQLVRTPAGRQIDYDALLIAVGASTSSALPDAVAIDPAHMRANLGGLIDEIDSGSLRALALVAPAPTWPLPVYEIALLALERARDRQTELDVEIITSEERPLDVFGEAVSSAIGRVLDEAGIELTVGAESGERSITSTLEARDAERGFDRIVAAPRLVGPAIPGLPSDSGGFLPITSHCEVVDAGRVYAAGDATDFPVKFGGIAAQQADAAAASIAELAGVAEGAAPFAGVVQGALQAGWEEERRIFFSASFESGRVQDSRTSEQPLSEPVAKIGAQRLGPYLDQLWAEGPRWIADQLSWGAVLADLKAQRAAEKH
jgi:sulfide:quinone oxidoreductase